MKKYTIGAAAIAFTVLLVFAASDSRGGQKGDGSHGGSSHAGAAHGGGAPAAHPAPRAAPHPAPRAAQHAAPQAPAHAAQHAAPPRAEVHSAPRAQSHAAPHNAAHAEPAQPHSYSRTPSMSRAVPRREQQPKQQQQARPHMSPQEMQHAIQGHTAGHQAGQHQHGQAPQNQPHQVNQPHPRNQPNLHNQQSPQNQPNRGAHTDVRQFVQQHQNLANPMRTRAQTSQFLQQRRRQPQAVTSPPGVTSSSVNTPPAFQPNAARFKQNFQVQQRNNLQTSHHVRNQVFNNHPNCANWFGDTFFHNHHGYPYFYRAHTNWWWCPSWGAVTTWLPFGWQYPIYYDTSGEPIELPSDLYSTDQGYVPPPPPEGYPEEEAPPQAAFEPTADDEWMPLGVFAAGMTANATSYTNMFVQLALGKTGEIAGTYYNSATDETHPLDGMVDEQSQEAAWQVSDNPDSPTMTTGLYNLTQNVVPVEVHFPDGTMQVWTFVRLNK